MQSRFWQINNLDGRAPDREVVTVFRFFIGIRLVVTLAALVVSFILNGAQQVETSTLLSLLETSLVLIYLSLPPLQRRLGRWYMPIALVVATLGPTAENLLSMQHAFFSTVGGVGLSDEFSRQVWIASQFQLAILLLTPLILVSWLYTYRYTLAYVLGLAILDVAIQWVLFNSLSANNVLRLAVLALFRTLFYLFFGYVINQLVAGQKRQNAELTRANQSLARYATTLEQLAISHERNRLAREFHDTLAHTLSAVAVQLEAVSALQKTDPQKASAMLAHSLAMTRSGLNETRRAIQALRASPLEDLGLRGALESLARSSAERFGWELRLDLAAEWNGLSGEVEHAIYRIAEEALRNAGDHAQAHVVTLALRRTEGRVELDLCDDGRGFQYAPAQLDDRYGLRGMIERAKSIGGVLTIQSRPGQGVHLHLSLAESAAAQAGLPVGVKEQA